MGFGTSFTTNKECISQLTYYHISIGMYLYIPQMSERPSAASLQLLDPSQSFACVVDLKHLGLSYRHRRKESPVHMDYTCSGF